MQNHDYLLVQDVAAHHLEDPVQLNEGVQDMPAHHLGDHVHLDKVVDEQLSQKPAHGSVRSISFLRISPFWTEVTLKWKLCSSKYSRIQSLWSTIHHFVIKHTVLENMLDNYYYHF